MEVTYYDKSGRKVPAPRHDTVPSNGSTLALVVVALVLIIGVGVWTWLNQREVIATSNDSEQTEHLITHDSLGPVYTYNGEGTMRVYVFTDPDSGIQYLISDKGGITPRLGKNGHIIGVIDEAVEDDEV